MSDPVMRIAGDNERGIPKRINFTVAALERAECPAGVDRIIIYDERVPGLALRVTDRGVKSFTFYRKWKGRPLKMKLGGFPGITIDRARQLAGQANSDIAQGKDPMEERRTTRTSITLQDLFDRYTKNHAELRSTDRTRETDKSRFDTCFADWVSRKISTITNDHVRDKHASIGRTRGKVTANRAVQLLHRILKWAKVKPNPAVPEDIDFFQEASRERFVQADELPKFFTALEAEPNDTVRDFIKVSLFTGARRSNVQSMRWDEVSIDRAEWKIPAEKSKNAEAMTLHLSPQTLQVLEARTGNDSEFVFPGRGKSGHLEEPKSVWKRILKAAEITDLRLHDLRRTLGSWQAAGGASLPIIGRSLGHKTPAATQIYARVNLDGVRASVDAAGAAIVAAAVPKKPAKVKATIRKASHRRRK